MNQNSLSIDYLILHFVTYLNCLILRKKNFQNFLYSYFNQNLKFSILTVFDHFKFGLFSFNLYIICDLKCLFT